MWVVSTEDKTVASTWGASIHLKAGEPRQVGEDFGLLCLQQGCTEVQEGEVSAMKPAPVEEVVVEEYIVEEIEYIEPVEEISMSSKYREKCTRSPTLT